MPNLVNWLVNVSLKATLVITTFILTTPSNATARKSDREILENPATSCRKHSASLKDFGGVGDGKTSNTKAFQTAIANLSNYQKDGGALLYVPPGKWLTGSFNLTNHFTLFLEKDAVLLATQVRLLLEYEYK
ncbi:lyase [Lithospermum erythrorhizon]|uniref:Lyase n=1 Tax=Lithospermum erythrorhizon TaxID=34254 RepID=A0AAV3QK99_LITER